MSTNKILVTGGTGMLGTALVDLLRTNEENDVLSLSSRHDLRNKDVVYELFDGFKPTHVYHLAAKVGGIMANMTSNATFYTDNVTMNGNVLSIAAETKSVQKVCSVLSTCIYPAKIKNPITEDGLHDGPPHSSNFGYAYAKRMIEVQSRALNEQFGTQKFITVTPNNMYGKHDNFAKINSHVIPALILKFYEAKQNRDETVTLWGTGSPLRQFSFVDDVARDMVFCMSHFQASGTINIGNHSEITINDLALLISGRIGYDGKIIWDHSKPDGQHRKYASTDKFADMYFNINGSVPSYHSLSEGLDETIGWFTTSYPNVRGIKNQ